MVGESVARVITRFMENMPMLRILLGLAATVIAMAVSMGAGPSLAQDKPALKEIETFAEEAYLYGFPMIVGYDVLYKWFIDRDSGQFKAPISISGRRAGWRVMQIPQHLQFGPGGGDVDGDEGDTVPAGGGLPAVQDEIALQGAGLHPRPLAPGAQGHLGAERADRGGQAPGLPGPAATQRAQQPMQRRGAGREQGRAHRRRQDDPVVSL